MDFLTKFKENQEQPPVKEVIPGLIMFRQRLVRASGSRQHSQDLLTATATSV